MAHSRLPAARQRNVAGAFYNGKFHPYRDSDGYDPARVGEPSDARLQAVVRAQAKRKMKTQTKNPDKRSAAHPVEVERYFRAEPTSHHVQSRRKGQKDLFDAGWKRNPDDFDQDAYDHAMHDYYADLADQYEDDIEEHEFDFAALQTPVLVIDEDGAVGKVLAESDEGKLLLEVADGTIELVDAADVREVKANGVGAWIKGKAKKYNDRRKAGNALRKELKFQDKHAAAKARRLELERAAVKNPAFHFNESSEATAGLPFHAAQQLIQGTPYQITFGTRTNQWHIIKPGAIDFDVFGLDAAAVKDLTEEQALDLNFGAHLINNDQVKQNPIDNDEIENYLAMKAAKYQRSPEFAKAEFQGLLVNEGHSHAVAKNLIARTPVDQIVDQLLTAKRAELILAQRYANRTENPSILATLANMGVAATSAVALGDRFKKPKKRNGGEPGESAARKLYKEFQGRKSTGAKEMRVSNHAPRHLSQLGDLVEIKLTNGQIFSLAKQNPSGSISYPFKLTASARNRQLWIAGGKFAAADRTINPDEAEPIGTVKHLVYQTYKPHLGDEPETHYIHALGEEGGTKPTLAVDREGYPVILGGDYSIEWRGIVD